MIEDTFRSGKSTFVYERDHKDDLCTRKNFFCVWEEADCFITHIILNKTGNFHEKLEKLCVMSGEKLI